MLSFDDPAIISAYDKAMLYNGKLVKAYVATNHKEYFTEAYLYRNDFYPFVNGELKKHDPRAFAQMQRAWDKMR